MLDMKFLLKQVARTETVAYWAHGLLGAFCLMVLMDENYLLYYVFYFPAAITLTLLTIVWGIASIPTAYLSLLLVAVLVKDFENPLLAAYVVCCIAIIGYRIFRSVLDGHAKAP